MASDVTPRNYEPLWKTEKVSGPLLGRVASKWRRVRKQFLKTQINPDGFYVCCGCGAWLQYPEVDHIKKRSTHPHLIFTFENLQVLCNPCHVKKDSGMKVKD